MTDLPRLPIPEQGQIVTVRQRRYVVADVIPSALPPDLLHKTGSEPQHLITLSSIEDDALGETLQVVWEIEPDGRFNERDGLPEPTGFDPPERFDAFLNAVRWGAISSADIRSLQAPFRSGVTIEDYQLDPLVRAVQMPRVNLLIADDVGLGKTIESGLIVQELILRNRVRTVLIVCPSSLQIQWCDQMQLEQLSAKYMNFLGYAILLTTTVPTGKSLTATYLRTPASACTKTKFFRGQLAWGLNTGAGTMQGRDSH